MPKPKDKPQTESWVGNKWHNFTPSQKQELIEYLGYDYYPDEETLINSMDEDTPEDIIQSEKELFKQAEQAITNIRFCVSDYDLTCYQLNNPLTDADYRKDLTILRDKACELYQAMDAVNQKILKSVEDTKVNIFDMRVMLSHFIGRTNNGIEVRPDESRGKKQNLALKVIVNQIGINFDKFFLDRTGDIHELAQALERTNFIKMVLSYANIDHAENIKRYYWKEGETPLTLRQW